MRIYYRDYVQPRVPERLFRTLSFDELYRAFGGKLAHWQDYITEFGMFQLYYCDTLANSPKVNSSGAIDGTFQRIY